MPSIRSRLVLWLLIWIGALWAVAGAFLYVAQKGHLMAAFDDDLTRDATNVRFLLGPLPAGMEARPDSDMLRQDTDLYYMAWRAGRGTVLLRSVSLAGGDLPRPEDLGLEPRTLDFELPDGRRLRGVGRQLRLRGGRFLGAGQPAVVDLLVARDRRELDRALFLSLAGIVFVGILGAAVTGLIVHLVLGRGLRPLDRLARQAEEIAPGSLDTRFETGGMPAELLPIAQRLNDLLQRLESGFERERQFSSDLAHELRTPVAELRAMAELAIRWPERASSRDYQEVRTISRRMQRILEDLLLLARWEQGAARADTRQVLLAEAVERCWAPLAGQSASRRHQVEIAVPADRTVKTHEGMLDLILSNLFANAVEYTPEGGSIHITGMRDNGRLLSVANTTRDLDPASVTRLFDRFWRADPSRTDDRHSGLGLSLAKASAEALSLDLTASLDSQGRLCLELIAVEEGSGRA